MMNQTEKSLQSRFLFAALEAVRSSDPMETVTTRHRGLTSEELDALAALKRSGFIVEAECADIYANDLEHIRTWDVAKTLEWGRSQQPKYRIVELQSPRYHRARLEWREWENSVGPSQVEYRAATPLYGYAVWDNRHGQWLWGVRSAVIDIDGRTTYGRHNDPPAEQCESADDGRMACEAHWLKALIDGGVIEELNDD